MGCVACKDEVTSSMAPPPFNSRLQPVLLGGCSSSHTKPVLGEDVCHARFTKHQPERVRRIYDIETSMLGQGAFGSVQRATHKETGVICAIKVMRKGNTSSSKRLRREAALLTMMDHPNIIKLLETYEGSQHMYLVMELCLGGEVLHFLLENGHLSESSTAIIMEQVLRGVSHMHASDVVHRDLKLQNLLLSSKAPLDKSVLKIVDFGLSVRAKPWEIMFTRCGSALYVSPQVLAGYYDSKCDLWSCGVVMYLLLVGFPPFIGMTDEAVFKRVKKGVVKFSKKHWHSISEDAVDLVRNLLKVSPQMRYTAEKALQHVWITCAACRETNELVEPSLVERLRVFRSYITSKKAALHAIATQLSDGEIERLRMVFNTLDGNGDGLLTCDELTQGLEHVGVTRIPSDLDTIVKGVDTDGNGVVDSSEFIAAVRCEITNLKEDRWLAAFRAFDLNGNGRIEQSEIEQVLAVDGMRECVGEKAAALLLEEGNKNGDGTIDFKKFNEIMRASAS
eukprot:TRINITY_DN5460_c0_g1_i2.p1 TRINITY_DN5460_c0_g1~~TRINITY_DN5460_c0_g1_i2.p1  ORF type:complete len:507 (+),score=79.52 TRINITY_DN5460_c0_g1_i2:61-1581(+)